MKNNEPQVTATLTDKGLSMIIDGKPITINKAHKNYDEIIQALRDGDNTEAARLTDLGREIEEMSEGHIKVVHGIVTFKGVEIENAVTTRLLQTIQLGLDPKPLARFLNRLMQNPSNHSVKQLYRFMEACDMPITEDGCLLAYRSVRDDYFDSHTKQTCLSYPPEALHELDGADLEGLGFEFCSVIEEYQLTNNGVTTSIDFVKNVCHVSMDRAFVDDDHNKTCSTGLHVCSQAYGKFSHRLLLVKVDPKDVVSVPTDYGNAKMRVCAYEVIKEVENFDTYEDAPIYYEDDEACDGEYDWF